MSKQHTEDTLDLSDLTRLATYMTAGAAHKAWCIEAARRHPDHGGDPQSSATFGAVWDRVKPLFGDAKTAAA
jgi:hypothetical protein